MTRVGRLSGGELVEARECGVEVVLGEPLLTADAARGVEHNHHVGGPLDEVAFRGGGRDVDRVQARRPLHVRSPLDGHDLGSELPIAAEHLDVALTVHRGESELAVVEKGEVRRERVP